MTTRPIRPDYSAAASNQPKALWHSVARQFLQRAATSMATSSSAAAIVPVGVTSLLTGLSPASAAMQLFANCARVDFAGVSQIVIPRVVSSTAPVFIAEGAPHTVVQSVFDVLPFGPVCKLLFAAVVTGELQTYTPGTASVIIAQALGEKVKLELDKVVFDATAATAGTRPAGLLNGVSDLGPTAGGGLAALTADLAKIAGAMGDAGIATDDLYIFTNPRQAVVMRGLLSPLFNRTYTIIGTTAIADKTIVGVAPNAIVSGYSGEPEIELSTQGTVNMEGATPQDITTAGVAAAGGVKSLWQSNLLAVRLRINCAWAPLMTGAVQKIVSVSW